MTMLLIIAASAEIYFADGQYLNNSAHNVGHSKKQLCTEEHNELSEKPIFNNNVHTE